MRVPGASSITCVVFHAHATRKGLKLVGLRIDLVQDETVADNQNHQLKTFL